VQNKCEASSRIGAGQNRTENRGGGGEEHGSGVEDPRGDLGEGGVKSATKRKGDYFRPDLSKLEAAEMS